MNILNSMTNRCFELSAMTQWCVFIVLANFLTHAFKTPLMVIQNKFLLTPMQCKLALLFSLAMF